MSMVELPKILLSTVLPVFVPPAARVPFESSAASGAAPWPRHSGARRPGARKAGAPSRVRQPWLEIQGKMWGMPTTNGESLKVWFWTYGGQIPKKTCSNQLGLV